MMALPQGVKEGFDTARSFLQEAWAELRRVQWPTQKEVRAATAVVIILVSSVAIFLFIVDAILSWFLQTFLGS
ncbi:MAG: preprotein translocase subunit SecE [Deltaproteobacteria bacterium]|nr:preprotein translocase subunit SecE [Deltaproteobacteria bacterium]